jgi:hypothetical protein
MDRVIKSNQAYDVTPWRKQIRRIFLFLAALVVLGVITGINLNVDAQAATIGRKIQNSRIDIDNLHNEIADNQAILAMLTSSVQMENRAKKLGFRRATSDEILYLVVNGYEKPSHAALAPETETFVPQPGPILVPEYSQTIWDLIKGQLAFQPGTDE